MIGAPREEPTTERRERRRGVFLGSVISDDEQNKKRFKRELW